MQTIKLIKKLSLTALLSMLVLASSGCDMFGGGDNDHSLGNEQENNDDDDDDGLPEEMKEVLTLSGADQLFGFKKSGGDTSAKRASDVEGSDHSDDVQGLYITATGKTKAKKYLSRVNFDRFEVVKDGSGLAYIGHLSKETMRALKKKRGGWFIFRNGKEPIALPSPEQWKNIPDDSEYVGQTETNQGLVFKWGSYFDLNGKKLPYGKNVGKVEYAQFVSGDYVAIKRTVKGSEVTTLINTKNSYRRGYSSYFTPDFVQLSDDGKGLMSDIQASVSYNFGAGGVTDTHISKLEDEFDPNNLDKDSRISLLKKNQIGNCLWFNSSVRIPSTNAALLTCYVSKTKAFPKPSISEYRLVRVESNGALGYKVDKIFTIGSESALSHVKRSRPFVQGKDFVVMHHKTSVLFVPNTNPVAGRLDINTYLSTVFDIRTSNDLTKFIVTGEKVNGEQWMISYDGSNGTKIEEVSIDVEAE